MVDNLVFLGNGKYSHAKDESGTRTLCGRSIPAVHDSSTGAPGCNTCFQVTKNMAAEVAGAHSAAAVVQS